MLDCDSKSASSILATHLYVVFLTFSLISVLLVSLMLFNLGNMTNTLLFLEFISFFIYPLLLVISTDCNNLFILSLLLPVILFSAIETCLLSVNLGTPTES